MNRDIPKFDEILSDFIHNKEVVSYSQKFLTSPGDNYGSLILAVDVKVKSQENYEELNLVAKLLPEGTFMRCFMNVDFTFRNELAFYQTILPTLEKLNNVQHLKFPKFYGGRLNLQSSGGLDENAVILLENLKPEGYKILDRFTGFDLETTKLILSSIAHLHASVIAAKENHPEEFEKTIKPYFEEFRIFEMGDNDEFMVSEVLVDGILNVIKEDEFCLLHFNRIKATVKTCVANLNLAKNSPEFAQDIFASLIHCDLWVNNIMIKTNYLNKIIDVKFLDWQLYEYASVAKDILFFLCSSVQESLFKENLDELINSYYESLYHSLKKMQCDIEKFNETNFQEELKRVAGSVAYFYVMIALPSIFAADDNVWKIEELNRERMLNQVKVSDVCKSRIWMITKKFIQKGWI